MAGAPKENTNAEKWTLDEASSFMELAVLRSEELEFDFIGEVAKELKQDKGVFDYIVEKFPELTRHKKRIKYNCEVNCFRNGKKGDIVPSLAIMNLKSNHGWTDRVDNTTKGGTINTPPEIEFIDTDED
jgi:hypothetical protein